MNLCIALLSPKSPMMESKQPYEYEVPLIQREFPVEEGHAGHAGRLDLFIHFAKVGLTWNIEVKKGTAEEADLAKNIGYSNALAATRQYRHCRHLLLVTEHEKEKYDEFCPVRWEELCVRIRKWIMSHRDGGLESAMLLLLCAIIEQKLLGIALGSIRQMEYIRTLMRKS